MFSMSTMYWRAQHQIVLGDSALWPAANKDQTAGCPACWYIPYHVLGGWLHFPLLNNSLQGLLVVWAIVAKVIDAHCGRMVGLGVKTIEEIRSYWSAVRRSCPRGIQTAVVGRETARHQGHPRAYVAHTHLSSLKPIGFLISLKLSQKISAAHWQSSGDLSSAGMNFI